MPGEPGGDRFGRALRDLRVSVTDRCNFRCPYCMPKEEFGDGYRFVPAADQLTDAETVRLAGVFADLGVRKLRITGGEPLLRRGLPDLIAALAPLRARGVDDIALTTNGFLLERHAPALAAAGLDRVTVSLDSLDPHVFEHLNGLDQPLEPVLRGIDAARAAGLAPIKINVVVLRGVNDGGVLDLVERFRGTGIAVRFIEYMDVGNRNGWSADQVVPSRRVVERIDAVHPLEPVGPAYAGEVARRYRYADGAGEIGFISSVSEPFCGDCTRAAVGRRHAVHLPVRVAGRAAAAAAARRRRRRADRPRRARHVGTARRPVLRGPQARAGVHGRQAPRRTDGRRRRRCGRGARSRAAGSGSAHRRDAQGGDAPCRRLNRPSASPTSPRPAIRAWSTSPPRPPPPGPPRRGR